MTEPRSHTNFRLRMALEAAQHYRDASLIDYRLDAPAYRMATAHADKCLQHAREEILTPCEEQDDSEGPGIALAFLIVAIAAGVMGGIIGAWAF